MIGLDLMGVDSDAVKKGIKDAAPGAIDAVVDLVAPKKDAKSDPKDDKKPDAKKPEGESFLSALIIGPVRVWHAMLGAVAAGGGVWYWKSRK